MVATRRFLIIAVLIIAVVQTCSASPVGPTYTGDLAYNDAEIAGVPGSNWLGGNPRLSWVVTWTGTTWNYAYNFSVDKPGGVSHFILETSPSFTRADISGVSGASTVLIDTWTQDGQGNSNPYMPLSGIYGIKFESFNPTGQYISVVFDSDRAPVWGDFYVKDGKVGGIENAVWNEGFTDTDVDPSDAPGNGTVGYHILRPDTQSGPNPSPAIPEPMSIMLGMMGLGSIASLKRFRR